MRQDIVKFEMFQDLTLVMFGCYGDFMWAKPIMSFKIIFRGVLFFALRCVALCCVEIFCRPGNMQHTWSTRMVCCFFLLTKFTVFNAFLNEYSGDHLKENKKRELFGPPFFERNFSFYFLPEGCKAIFLVAAQKKFT